MAPAYREDDEDLLRLARRQPEAFGRFYERHEEKLVAYFMRRTKDAEVTADLVAETFAEALRCAHRFKPGPTPAVAWLFGIARNVLRESWRRGQVIESARRKLGMERVEVSDASLERIEHLVDAERSAKRLEELMNELPPAHREAVLARIVEERDYEEIATRMKTSQALVRQRVSRGLSQLRIGLEQRP